MSGRSDGRFEKGRSGNPKGRPRARRPHVSAFYLIFDKTLTVTQGGKERELTVDDLIIDGRHWRFQLRIGVLAMGSFAE